MFSITESRAASFPVLRCFGDDGAVAVAVAAANVVAVVAAGAVIGASAAAVRQRISTLSSRING